MRVCKKRMLNLTTLGFYAGCTLRVVVVHLSTDHSTLLIVFLKEHSLKEKQTHGHFVLLCFCLSGSCSLLGRRGVVVWIMEREIRKWNGNERGTLSTSKD